MERLEKGGPVLKTTNGKSNGKVQSTRTSIRSAVSLLVYILMVYSCVHHLMSYFGLYGSYDTVVSLDCRFPSVFEATTEDLIVGLESGSFTSVDLVKTYVARINEVNAELHAINELNPDALSIAAALDLERENGVIRGPLHGIPILVKDNIATMDQMNNTGGSYSLVGAKVPYDSTVVAKLRKAGAVILGKTNLSQWAHFRSHNASNGWSSYGGQTMGAYYPRQDPSGSSSGSGVASSLGLTLGALGTETAGSITLPACMNNVVGIKPSVGLTSRHLVVPITEHTDTVGPLARTVKDAAYILQAIVGADPRDNYTDAIPFDKIPDYVAACKFSALQGARIGIPRNVIEKKAATEKHEFGSMLTAFESALDVLRSAGAIIVENTNYSSQAVGDFPDFTWDTMIADFHTNFLAYTSLLTLNPNNITDLASLLEYTTKTHPELEGYPEYDVDAWKHALSLNYTNHTPMSDHFWNLSRTLFGRDAVFGAIQNHSLDALILPSAISPGAPAVVGAPIISVPMGSYPEGTEVMKSERANLTLIAPNIPFGLAFIGERFSEETLIGLAYAFEQRTQFRDKIKPYKGIIPKTDLANVVGERLKTESGH